MPDLDFILIDRTDAAGETQLAGTWPAGLPSGFQVFLQSWLFDPAGAAGFAATPAMRATVP